MSEVDAGIKIIDFFAELIQEKVPDVAARRDLVLRGDKMTAAEGVRQGIVGTFIFDGEEEHQEEEPAVDKRKALVPIEELSSDDETLGQFLHRPRPSARKILSQSSSGTKRPMEEITLPVPGAKKKRTVKRIAQQSERKEPRTENPQQVTRVEKNLPQDLAESRQASRNAEEKARGYHNSLNQVQVELENIRQEKVVLETSLAQLNKEKSALQVKLEKEQKMHKGGKVQLLQSLMQMREIGNAMTPLVDMV
ncbi:hypothetical protein BAE44_0013907 [Dichanthelium oligosanthes]|uniref:Uncharacterized protein n=1 Tax=Dichanthelium oligosanthes TaxID=888268 RepID=A0A1E5VJ29_9POAL|nr:hypothetical protein BAE44_0013907 [Dichanthelium oligosanthes]